MATHKQAEKRHRQSVKRAERNRYYEATLRGLLKGARTAIAGGTSAAVDAVKSALAYVDQVAGKGVIPRSRADRLKSRLGSQVAALPAKKA